jgi:uncharacterized protein (TIGR02271 family)
LHGTLLAAQALPVDAPDATRGTQASQGMNPIRNVGAAPDSSDDGDALVVPVLAETLHVDVREVSHGGVRVHREQRDERVRVDPPLRHTRVDIERRVLNQLLDGPPPEPHQDGPTLVIPVLEEVAVVQRRWLLKEELRVTRSEQTAHQPQDVVLRRDHVTVERFSDAGESADAGSPPPTNRKET